VKASLDAGREADQTKRQLSTLTTGVPPANERVSASKTRAKVSSKDRSPTSDLSNRRSIDEIDRDEIMAAIRDVFKSGESLDPETAIPEIARVLGFRRAGARISEELRSALRTAIRRQIINHDKGVISIQCAMIDDYTRGELIETLLATIGSTWWDREDAIRSAARRLGFRRTGRRITAAFRSAINGAIRRGSLEYDGELIRVVK